MGFWEDDTGKLEDAVLELSSFINFQYFFPSQNVSHAGSGRGGGGGGGRGLDPESRTNFS